VDERTASPVVLPRLTWHPTAASGNRHGHPVTVVVVHRWGVRYVDTSHEKLAYAGVVRYFSDPANDASAHIVFPGSAAPGVATQMVSWAHLAWTQAAYNPAADDVESADAIWLGHDAHGMATLARIVACRLHARNLPPVWSHTHGFCRHADLGAAGGGHSSCPTTNLTLWRHFVGLVKDEFNRGGCRPWGR
jgi:hypothetical protein